MKKRGQEGVTLTTLLLIILGIVVIVVIIIGFTQGFGFITDIFSVAPGKSLEAAVQSCGIAADSNLKNDYCVEFKKVEIDGVEKYVTCEWLFGNDYTDKGLDDGCGDLGPNYKVFCESKKLKPTVILNEEPCSQYLDAK